MTTKLAAAIFALAASAAWAHRLDEYLQGTILSVEHDRLQAQMTLTPGVAVLPLVMAEIDRDADGEVSAEEQQTYAQRVLNEVSLAIDGVHLTPRLASVRFPALAEMKEGRGEIQIEWVADLPRGGRNRRLLFENHHQSRLSVYQVNVLVPRDPAIGIVAQNRNYTQSRYELEYAQMDVQSDVASKLSGGVSWIGAMALLLATRFVLVKRRAATAPSPRSAGPPSGSSHTCPVR